MSSLDVQRARPTHSQVGTAFFFWLTGAGVLLLFAPLIVFTPWYISTGISASLILGIILLFKPTPGVYLLIFLVPITSFSVGFVPVAPWNYIIFYRYADKFSLLTPLVPLTVLGVLFVKLTRLRNINFRDPLLLTSIILVCYAALTLSWSANMGHSIFELHRLLINVLLYLTVVSLIDSEKKYRTAMWIWIISMLIQSILAVLLFAYKSVDELYQITPTFLFHFKIFGGMLLKTGTPNTASGLQDFHETSLLTNMAAAVSFGILTDIKKRKKFILVSLFISFFLFISMRTESRAGIGSMLVMLVLLALMIPSLKSRRFRMAVIFMFSAASIYILSHIYIATMTEVTQKPRMLVIIEEILGGGKLIDTGHKKKENGRMYMYERSFHALFSHNPLLGLGIGNLKYLVQLPHAHSLYFSLVLDFGLLGIFFLAILAKVLTQQFYNIVMMPDNPARTMALASTAGLIGASVHCLADFEYNYTSLWLFLGFVMASYNIANDQQNASDHQSSVIQTT